MTRMKYRNLLLSIVISLTPTTYGSGNFTWSSAPAATNINSTATKIQMQIEKLRSNFPTEADRLMRELDGVRRAETLENAISSIDDIFKDSLRMPGGEPKVLEKHIPAITEQQRVCNGHRGKEQRWSHSNAEKRERELRAELLRGTGVDSSSVWTVVEEPVPAWANYTHFWATVWMQYDIDWSYKHLTAAQSPCSDYTVTTVVRQKSRTEQVNMSGLIDLFEELRSAINTEKARLVQEAAERQRQEQERIAREAAARLERERLAEQERALRAAEEAMLRNLEDQASEETATTQNNIRQNYSTTRFF